MAPPGPSNGGRPGGARGSVGGAADNDPFMSSPVQTPDFWPSSGHGELHRTARGGLQATAAWLRRWLARPELALVEESCTAEKALHAALAADPQRPVGPAELQALADADVRSNYAAFVAFRDGLLAAGSLQAWYLAQIRKPLMNMPPAFVAGVVHAIVRHLLGDCTDAFQARAAELLFRPQRVTATEGRLLSADLAVIDLLNQTAGLGDLGRLLVDAQAPLRPIDMQVLAPHNVDDYWRRAERHDLLLDLTHEVSNDLGHGIVLKLARTHSGPAALARVLEAWTLHFLGVAVKIRPLQRIDDPAWRWHIGLDAESMGLLNDLYEDRTVEPERLARLICLFRLDFDDPADMRPDVAGYPVYLGLATSADGVLKLKPQNLLLNLPLAGAT